MSEDSSQPPQKKFVKTGTVIKEMVTKMGKQKDDSKKSSKKSD